MRPKKSSRSTRLGSQIGAEITAQIESQIESALEASFLTRGGLRERKKAQTRLRISDVATAMFLERGFDEVTVAEVAKAADVSVKTVFNYFGAKEDLLFDREPEWLASIDELGRRCGPGCGLIRVLIADVSERWPALEFGRWDLLTEEVLGGRRAFYRLVEEHPVLHARRQQMGQRIGDRLAEFAAQAFDDPDSPESLTAGALIHAAYDIVGREYTRALLAGAPAAAVVDRARSVGLHALSVLEDAYAGTPLVEGPPA